MFVATEERRGAAGGGDESSSPSGPRSAEGPSPRPVRRSFSPVYKLAIVAEYENAPNGEKGAILRREGLYSSHVIEWTRARDAGRWKGWLIPGGRRNDRSGRGGRRVRTAPGSERETRSRVEEDPDRVGHHGKSTRALGAAVRERGRPGTTDAAEEVMNTAFAELRAAKVPIAVACAMIGRFRATRYRRADPFGAAALGPAHGPPPPRRPPPSTITGDERARVLALLNSEPYRDLAIPPVWARELDGGRYWCSESSMYRIARDAGQSRQRRAQATHPARVRPELVAHGPSEVWSWDITALKGPRKGEWYKLYVVLDIFSRYVPGWLVANVEDAVVAKDFLAGAVERNLVIPHTLHADRGGSMTSKPVSEMLIDLGILRSHSRPRTSNDNPYSPGPVQDPQIRFPTSRTGSAHSPTHARSATGSSPPTTTSTATPGSACTPRPQSTSEPRPRSAYDARPPSTVPTHGTPSGSAAGLSRHTCPKTWINQPTQQEPTK